MKTGFWATCVASVSILSAFACGDAPPPAEPASVPAPEPAPPAPGPAPAPAPVDAVIRLPQFVRGAAMVNPGAFPAIPVVVEASEGVRDVDVYLDDEKLPVSRDGARFVATATIGAIPEGGHTIRASVAGAAQRVEGKLVLSRESVYVTRFADQGTVRTGTIHHDVRGDRLLATWVDRRSGELHAYVGELDGAGRRLRDDVRVDTSGTEAIRAYSALGEGHLGLLYQTNKRTGWSAHLAVVRPDGTPVSPSVELTDADIAYQGAAVAWSKRGYAAIWQHVTPPDGVTELRAAFVDPKSGTKSAPIVLAREDDTTGGAGKIAHLGLFGLACNDAVCVASYVRDVHVNLTDLDTPKVHVAVIDLATGAKKTAFAVARSNWDLQEDASVTALPDGTFAVAFVGASTTHLDPEACGTQGMSMDRKLLRVARLTASGDLVGVRTIVDEPAPRFQPAVGALPSGLAIAWEDQRSQCSGGTNRLALNRLDGADKLAQPYIEVPQTRIIGQVWPSLAAAGTNAIVTWMNDRTGSIVDPRPEMLVETYWGR